MYLNFATGLFSDTIIDPTAPHVQIMSKEEWKARDGVGEYPGFATLIEEKFAGDHLLIMCSEEDCNNMDFLTFICRWYNESGDAKQTEIDELRFIELPYDGISYLFMDNGYIEFGLASNKLLMYLQEWYKRYLSNPISKTV